MEDSAISQIVKRIDKVIEENQKLMKINEENLEIISHENSKLIN